VRPGSAARFLPTIVLFCGLWPAAVSAALGVYTGQVPVASQSEADRSEGLKAALGQVVARVAGDPAVLSRPEVVKALDQAERYVQQFQYVQEAAVDNGQPQLRLSLVAEFDHDAVDRLAHYAGTAQQGSGTREAAADAPPAPLDNAPASSHVWVGGVRSASDYARLMGALSGNDYVRDAQVELARGDGVQLRLATSVPLARVLDALNAGPVLRVTNAKPPVDGIDALLDLKP